jgi:hypothetical protein
VTDPVTEPAADAPEAAAAPQQVEVVEPEKPNYITREEWEKERADVAARAAADALETDRRKRQTENARKAKADQDRAERRQRAMDTVKAAFGARGVYEVPDEAVTTAISRVAQDEAEAQNASTLERFGEAMDWIGAPVTGEKIDRPEGVDAMIDLIAPRLQNLFNTARPLIEQQAAEKAIAEFKATELPKLLEADRAARNQQKRDGQEELTRVEGTPASTNTGSIEYWDTRVAHEGEDGYPSMSAQDWATYRQIRAAHGLS